MHILRDQSWMRRGIALLWNADALTEVAATDEAVPIRVLLNPDQPWRDELPSNNGQAIVVVGLEGCLDVLAPEEAATWLEETLVPAILDFQSAYEGQVALIFWLPSGRKRLQMDAATEDYTWLCDGEFHGQTLPFGRLLWAGAQSDVRRIMTGKTAQADPDGPDWIGLHQQRLS